MASVPDTGRDSLRSGECVLKKQIEGHFSTAYGVIDAATRSR